MRTSAPSSGSNRTVMGDAVDGRGRRDVDDPGGAVLGRDAQPGGHRVPAVVPELQVEMVEGDRRRVGDVDPLARQVAAAAVPRGRQDRRRTRSTRGPWRCRGSRSRRHGSRPGRGREGRGRCRSPGRRRRRSGARCPRVRTTGPSAARSAATSGSGRAGHQDAERVRGRPGAERAEQVTGEPVDLAGADRLGAGRRVLDHDLLEPDAGLAPAAGLGGDAATLLASVPRICTSNFENRCVGKLTRVVPRRSMRYTRPGAAVEPDRHLGDPPTARAVTRLREHHVVGRHRVLELGDESFPTDLRLPRGDFPCGLAVAVERIARPASGVNPKAGVP